VIHPQINDKPVNNEYSTSTTFKAIIYETSVYQYIVELKENVFTEQGFLDLVKVPGLRVAGTGQFLKNLRLKSKLLQKDIAELFGVSISQVSYQERNGNTIPLQPLIEIAHARGTSRDAIYLSIAQGEFSIKNVALPVNFEKIREIAGYLSPSKYGINITKCPKEILSTIKATLNVHISQGSPKRISSKELHNYLTTFFHYTKVPKINPPLTEEVKHWREQGVDLKRMVIIPCLQSDGTSKQKQRHDLTFLGNSQILHDYFLDAMHYEYNELPTAYFVNKSGSSSCYTTFNQNSVTKILNEIMKLAGNTKTSPAIGQTVEDYLKEPQPHLDYLINASETELKIALRIWASTEGYISINRSKGLIYPMLGIACAHPDLATAPQQIAKQFNIKFTKKRSKNTWSGIKVLVALTISSCIAFLKLGGFIKGVEVSSNSRYHKGFNKDVLLLGILEFIKRERNKDFYRNLPLKEVHNEINKIIENKEYKSADYYIEYFS
jgi:transcriptional regulator with XRE-family HTH domain